MVPLFKTAGVGESPSDTEVTLSWYDLPFLWAESYFYRKLLHAVDFFSASPWYWHDPFAFLKNAELRSQELETDLKTLNAGTDEPIERTRSLLRRALWGNRADLGFIMGSEAPVEDSTTHDNIIVDDTMAVVDGLHTGNWPTISFIADNAGRELLADLILIDHLLCNTKVTKVNIHLKSHPYYVSAATTTDLVACLNRLTTAGGHAANIARRLKTALADQHLKLNTHWFHCAPQPFHRAPPDLTAQLTNTTLTILKGDLNYRRLVGDHHWPPSTPFETTVDTFPTPVVALRTLKSDVIVGLDHETVDNLDATDTNWRTTGKYGLIQANL